MERLERIQPGALVVASLATGDREAIMELEDLELMHFGRAGQNLWNLMPLVEHGRAWLGRLDGEPVAWAIALASLAGPGRAVLLSLGVAKRHRLRGIGRAFLSSLHEELAALGLTRLEVTVSPANLAALKLFRERCGYELVRSLPGWFGDGEDRYLLARDLQEFAPVTGGEHPPGHRSAQE